MKDNANGTRDGCENQSAQVRELAASTLRAAQLAKEQELAQARSFRNILMLAIFITFMFAVAFAVWGAIDPVPIAQKLCFSPVPGEGPPASPPAENLVCPVGTASCPV